MFSDTLVRSEGVLHTIGEASFFQTLHNSDQSERCVLPSQQVSGRRLRPRRAWERRLRSEAHRRPEDRAEPVQEALERLAEVSREPHRIASRPLLSDAK